MKKLLFALLMITAFAKADVLEVKSFESDIFSNKNNQLKKVELSLLFEGRDLLINEHKVKDSLNVIISSFYIEELFTSKGKERFKTLLTQYASKKHMVELENIYIIKFRLKEPIETKTIIQYLKKQEESREREDRAINYNDDTNVSED